MSVLVLPQHANHHGNTGGEIMNWMTQLARLVAIRQAKRVLLASPSAAAAAAATSAPTSGAAALEWYMAVSSVDAVVFKAASTTGQHLDFHAAVNCIFPPTSSYSSSPSSSQGTSGTSGSGGGGGGGGGGSDSSASILMSGTGAGSWAASRWR